MNAATRGTRGKPPNYTPEQNEALRRALTAFLERNKLGQAELGAKLGIRQQNVSRLLTGKDAGFSAGTARRAALLLGFSGVDNFFASQGLALGFRLEPTQSEQDAGQARGMMHARGLGVSEKAIELVNARVDPATQHAAAWWAMRYLEQQDALIDAARAVAESAAPKSSRTRRGGS